MSRTHAPVRRAPAPAAALLVPGGGQPEREAARGDVPMPFSSTGMRRGYAGVDGRASVAVFRE